MALDEIIAQSGRIVEARVLDVDIAAGDTRAPRTRVVLAVEQGVLGDGGGSLVLWLPEGIEADGMGWSGYEGVPGFVPGERYLLFLRRAPWRVSPVVQWSSAFLRRVEVAGRSVWVDAQGRCATAVESSGFVLGPRVAEPPAVPGRGLEWSAAAIEASAAGRCVDASALIGAVERRMQAMAWRPGTVASAPSDRSLEVDVAEPGR